MPDKHYTVKPKQDVVMDGFLLFALILFYVAISHGHS